jgi:hypothetical protein
MRVALLALLIACACGGAKPAGPPAADECADAAQNVALLSETSDAEAVAATEEECKTQWTREELACVRAATEQAAIGACFRAAE